MRLTELDARFDEIWDIYEEAFPEIERRTREGQRKAMENPYYRLLVKEEAGQILAFLGYWDLPGCCFIEHLATTAACRGKGYGRELVEECISYTEKPIFLEIEPVTNEDPMTRRRAVFYERLGFCCNRFPYEQMPLKEGDRPCPLWVMSYREPVDEKEFKPYKTEIYREVYQTVCD